MIKLLVMIVVGGVDDLLAKFRWYRRLWSGGWFRYYLPDGSGPFYERTSPGTYARAVKFIDYKDGEE